MELKDITDYPELVDYIGYRTLYEQMLGMYQGDWVFVVQEGSQVGLLIIGYGSCTYCDPLEHARDFFYWDEEKEENYEALQQLVNELRSDVRWFDSMGNLLRYAKSDECSLNNWYGSDKEFQDFIRKVELDAIS